MIIPRFHLHSSQGLVLRSKSRFKVLCAGRRWGKTHLALIALLLEALRYPDARLWYVAPTYRQAKQISWVLIKALVGQVPAEYNETELSVRIKQTGSLIELKGADNEDSLRGVGLGTRHNKGGLALLVDEFAAIHNNWSVWNEVLRPMLSDHRSGAMFISTPKGKDAFYDLYLAGERGEDGWESWTFPTSDNPYIDQDEIAEAKRTLPERYFEQEYEGSFEGYHGLIYPEFKDEHIVKPYEIPSHLTRIGGIDPALSGTTACLKGAMDGDTLVVYEEYYEQDKRVSEVAQAIRDDNIPVWLIDPSAHIKNVHREGKLYSLADEYMEYGVPTMPAENDVLAGINRVGEWLKTGRVRIFSTCKNLIYELRRYHWAEPRETVLGITTPKPYKSLDHACDVFRYMIASRVIGEELKEELNPMSPWGRLQAAKMSRDDYKYARE